MERDGAMHAAAFLAYVKQVLAPTLKPGDDAAELNDDGALDIEFRYHLGNEAELKARRW